MRNHTGSRVLGRVATVLAAALTLSLAACAAPASEGNGNSETGADSSYQGIVPIYTPRQGGSAYIVGGGIADLLSKSVDGVQGSVEATTGTQEMVLRLSEKQAAGQPAFIIADSAGQARALNGQAPFEQPYEDLRALAFLQDTALHLVVRADSTIESIADLEGATIGMGVPGSPVNFLTKEIFEAHGLAEDNYQELPYGYEEVADSLTNGSIDAGVIGGAVPVSTITELAAQLDIRFVPVDPAVMEEVEAEAPYLFSIPIPAGSYQGVDQDVMSYGFSTSISTHKDTPDSLVSEIMEILYGQTEQLAKVHASANEISLDRYNRGIAIVFHPAAIAFYEAEGVTLSE